VNVEFLPGKLIWQLMTCIINIWKIIPNRRGCSSVTTILPTLFPHDAYKMQGKDSLVTPYQRVCTYTYFNTGPRHRHNMFVCCCFYCKTRIQTYR